MNDAGQISYYKGTTMFLKRNFKHLIIPIVLGISSFSIFSGIKSLAGENNYLVIKPQDTLTPKCYSPMIMPLKEDSVKELQNQLNSLEKLYSEHKIDKKTYEIRKKYLQDKLKSGEDKSSISK